MRQGILQEIRRWGLLAALCLALPTPPARACELAIVWKADLSGSAKMSMGTAAIQFDLTHPGATVQVDTKNLNGVQAIDLRVSRSYADHAGPTVISIYQAAEGPLPVSLTKRVTDADLQKQTSPKIVDLSDVVQAVLNHRAYVVVVTKDHPEGEWSGFITMHKEAVYSDNPADVTHDAALHRAAHSKLDYGLTSTVNGTVSH